MSLLPAAIATRFARQILLTQTKAPELLLASGILSMVASTVLASKATLKMEPILESMQHDLAVAKSITDERYTESERNHDIYLSYAKGTGKIVKEYAPAVVFGVVAVGCLVKGHNILSQRNTALAAAYTALDKGFREYRARVIDKEGEEQDRYYRYGSEKVTIKDPETGKKNAVIRVPDGLPSVYARFFDDSDANWSDQTHYNLTFLRTQQNYFNDMLRIRGHVFLNEVYDGLGMKRSEAGQEVGWAITKDPNYPGDGFIDFGIWDGSERARDFVNGHEGAILLDFNVDGPIRHMIGLEF